MSNLEDWRIEIESKFERLEQQIAEIKEKLNDVEAMTKHSHPSFKQQIAELQKVKVNWGVQIKHWFEEYYNPKVDNLEEVLRDHLESHKKVSKDQLDPENDREKLFYEFDKAIEKQLEKLDSPKVGSARQTEEKYRLKFRDIITDVIDIMGLTLECEETKELREYLEGIGNEYILIKKKECKKKVYCQQCNDFINNLLQSGEVYCKKGYNCYEHAKILRALYRHEDSGGEKELPKRENGLNHSHGINGEPTAHHSKPTEPKAEPTRSSELLNKLDDKGVEMETVLQTEPEKSDLNEMKLKYELIERQVSQKQELISEFLVKMKDIYFSLGDDKVENLMFAELKQEYEGRLKN